MHIHADKKQENNDQATAKGLPAQQSSPGAYQQMANNSPQVKQLRAYQAMADSYTSQNAQQTHAAGGGRVPNKFNTDKPAMDPGSAQIPSTIQQPIQRVLKSGQYDITKESTMRDADHKKVGETLKVGERVTVDDRHVMGSLFTTGIWGIGKKEHSWSSDMFNNEGWVVDEALQWVPPVVEPRKPVSGATRAFVAPVKSSVGSGGASKPAEQAPVAPQKPSSAASKATVVVAPAPRQKTLDEQTVDWIGSLQQMNYEHIDAAKKYLKTNRARLQQPTIQVINRFLRVHGLNTKKSSEGFIAEIENQFQDSGIVEPMVIFSKIMIAVNKSLVAHGCPEITVKQSADVGNSGGTFDFKTWEMLVNPAYARMNTYMATLLYHESRHSEQWFKMIISQLRKGKKKAEIIAQMTVPGRIVDLAAEKVGDISPSEIAAADVYHQSVYGTGAAKRTAVLNSGKIHDKAQPEHKAYINLPEEVDAYDTQKRVAGSLGVRIKEIVKMIADNDEPGIIWPLLQKLIFLCEMDGKPEKVKAVAIQKIAKLGAEKMAALPSYVRNTLNRKAE